MNSIYSGDIKKQAKDALSQQWGIAILVMLIITILTQIGTLIQYVDQMGNQMSVMINIMNSPQLSYQEAMNEVGVYQAPLGITLFTYAVQIITIPLSFGSAVFFVKMIRKQRVEISDIFSMYKSFGKCFLASLYVGILIMLQFLLLIIPGIIAAYRYSMVTYIIADMPNVSVTEAATMSKEMMKGHKGELFAAQMSFLGWFILSIFTAGILQIVYVGPYYNAAMAAFYDRAKYDYDCRCGYNQNMNQMNDDMNQPQNQQFF